MYMFLWPLGLGILLLGFLKKNNIRKVVRDRFNRRKSKPEIYLKIKLWYERVFLPYSPKVNFESVLRYKLIVFTITFILIFTFKITNVRYYTNLITQSVSYKSDVLYQIKVDHFDETAFQEELEIFHEYLKRTDEDSIKLLSKEDLIFEIERYIRSTRGETMIPLNALSNRIYYRVTDYYHYRKYNFKSYMGAAFLVSFITEIIFLILKLNNKSKAHEELRYLKRLVLLYGSIKPVRFMDILMKIRQKTKYHQSFFQSIYEANIQTSANLKKVYSQFINREKDIDMKLFYEKLDQANNYDFDQAIINIRNEFRLERKARERQVKKRVTLINLTGAASIIIMLTLLTYFYLLMPWLETSLI